MTQISLGRSSCQELACLLPLCLLNWCPTKIAQVGGRKSSSLLPRALPLWPTHVPEAGASWSTSLGEWILNLGLKACRDEWHGKACCSVKLVHPSTEGMDILPTFCVSALEDPSHSCSSSPLWVLVGADMLRVPAQQGTKKTVNRCKAWELSRKSDSYIWCVSDVTVWLTHLHWYMPYCRPKRWQIQVYRLGAWYTYLPKMDAQLESLRCSRECISILHFGRRMLRAFVFSCSGVSRGPAMDVSFWITERKVMDICSLVINQGKGSVARETTAVTPFPDLCLSAEATWSCSQQWGQGLLEIRPPPRRFRSSLGAPILLIYSGRHSWKFFLELVHPAHPTIL